MKKRQSIEEIKSVKENEELKAFQRNGRRTFSNSCWDEDEQDDDKQDDDEQDDDKQDEDEQDEDEQDEDEQDEDEQDEDEQDDDEQDDDEQDEDEQDDDEQDDESLFIITTERQEADLSEGVYRAKVVKVSAQKKEEGWVRIKIDFEVKAGKEKHTVSFMASNNMGPSGRLRPIVAGIVGEMPRGDFNLKKLEGMKTKVVVKNNERNDQIWSNVVETQYLGS